MIIKRKRKSKSRAKSVRLSCDFWLRNSREIKTYREDKLKSQKGLCAITGIPLEVGVLDHTHEGGCGSEGRCRSVLLSEINMLEGRYLKIFKRLKLDEKYDLTFPELLINMGTYLQKDNSEEPLHFKYMDDFRKKIKRLTKPELISKLKSDFGIPVSKELLFDDIVQIYMQNWIHKLEKELSEEM